MKVYSEILNKLYDTKEDCEKAEQDYQERQEAEQKAKKEKEANRKVRAEEVENLRNDYKNVLEIYNQRVKELQNEYDAKLNKQREILDTAYNKYAEALKQFNKDYNGYNITIHDMFDEIFSHFWR